MLKEGTKLDYYDDVLSFMQMLRKEIKLINDEKNNRQYLIIFDNFANQFTDRFNLNPTFKDYYEYCMMTWEKSKHPRHKEFKLKSFMNYSDCILRNKLYHDQYFMNLDENNEPILQTDCSLENIKKEYDEMTKIKWTEDEQNILYFLRKHPKLENIIDFELWTIRITVE